MTDQIEKVQRANQFTSEDQPSNAGRGWLSNEERSLLFKLSPKVVVTAVELVDNPDIAPKYRLEAMEIILKYAYGIPNIATLVAFEVDELIERYGLPKRSKMNDRNGKPLFGRFGGFKPTYDYSTAFGRQQALEAFQKADELQEREELEAQAIAKLSPSVMVYQGSLQPKAEALKLLHAEQRRVSEMRFQILQTECELKAMRESCEDAEVILNDMQDAYDAMPADPQPEPQPEPLQEPLQGPQEPQPQPEPQTACHGPLAPPLEPRPPSQSPQPPPKRWKPPVSLLDRWKALST